MSGETEVGECEVCGVKNTPLNRTTFHYALKCECHSPNHFEMIRHCNNCIPKEPKVTNICMLTSNLVRNG